MLLLLWRTIAYSSVLEGKLKPMALWPSMQQDKTGSSLWFLAPETGDTHSFNHLGCDTIHHLPQTPDFKPTYSASLRQPGSLNAYRFVHTVQWRKIRSPKSASWASRVGRSLSSERLPTVPSHQRETQAQSGFGQHFSLSHPGVSFLWDSCDAFLSIPEPLSIWPLSLLPAVLSQI